MDVTCKEFVLDVALALAASLRNEPENWEWSAEDARWTRRIIDRSAFVQNRGLDKGYDLMGDVGGILHAAPADPASAELHKAIGDWLRWREQRDPA